MTLLPSPIPHPLDYCPFDVPAWAYEALEWVVGFDWPAGNEVATWDVADRWYLLAKDLAEPHDATFQAAGQVLAGYGGSGITADGFRNAWQALAGDENAPLNALLHIADNLGELVEGCGRDLEAAKLEAWIEIGTFLIELIGMAITVALTLGAASPAAGGLIMATRMTIQQIFKRLIEQLGKQALKETAKRALKEITTKEGLTKLTHKALHEGLDEAREEFATNSGVQLYQESTGRSHGFSVSDLGLSAAGGFAGGASATGSSVGAHGHHAGVARGAGGEVLAEFGASAAFGDLPSLENVAKSGVSGAAGSALHSGGEVSAIKIDSSLGTAGEAPDDGGDVAGQSVGAVAAESSLLGVSEVPLAGVGSGTSAALVAPDSSSALSGAEALSPLAGSDPFPGSTLAGSDLSASLIGPDPSPASDVSSGSASLSGSDVSRSSPFAGPDPSSASESFAGPNPSSASGSFAGLDPSTASGPFAGPDPSTASSSFTGPDSPTTSGSFTGPDSPTASGSFAGPDSPTASSSFAGPDPSSAASPFFGSDSSSAAHSGPDPSLTPSSGHLPAPQPDVASVSSAAGQIIDPAHHSLQADISTGPSTASSSSPATPALSLSAPSALTTPGVTPQPTLAGAGVAPGSTDALAGGTFAHLTTGMPPSSPADPGPATPGATTARRPLSDLDRIAAALDPRPATSSNRTPSIPRQPSRRPFTHSTPPTDFGPPPPSYRHPHPATIRNESGYFGYANHARRVHELNRRDEHIEFLTDVAEQTRAKILGLGQQADQAFRDGLTLRGEDHRRRATELSAIVEDIENQIDRVRTGELAPATIEVAPGDWARINADVGDLAPGGVHTDDRSALTGTGDPRPIDRTRHYNTSGGLRAPLAVHQTDLEEAVPRDGNGRPQRLPDPRKGRWFRLANDGGPEADPTRALNCVDGVLSLFDTYIHGRPRVSAPRTFDTYAHGNPDRPLGGEVHGVRRIQEATGSIFQNLCPYVGGVAPATAKPAMDLALRNLTNHLHNTGHGAYAFIITDMESGGSHAWAATNHNGTILFLDPQIGKITENLPLYHHRGVPSPANITSLNALVVDGRGVPAPLPHHGPGQRAASPTGIDGHEPPQDFDRAVGHARRGETPETAAERQAFESLEQSEQAYLEAAYDNVEQFADNALAELRILVGLVPVATDGPSPRVVDEAARRKTPHSMARAFLEHATIEQTSIADFLEGVKDRVRFSVEVPEAGYGKTVAAVLNAMTSRGYEVQKILSFWGSGQGRHNGLNVTLADPHGRLMEVQFPTPLSRRVGKETHRFYERLRLGQFGAKQRVEALLTIISINRRNDLPAHQPGDLEALDAVGAVKHLDTSLARWIRANPTVWRQYVEALNAEGVSLDAALRSHNLRYDDLFDQ